MSGSEARAKNVASGPSGRWTPISRFQQARPSGRLGRRLRERRLRVPLSPSQQLIARRLASRTPQTVEDPAISQAGVAIILGSDPDAILLIRRSERIGDPWSGHMGFPGGRRGLGDEHLLATTIRETMEEIGLSLTPAELLGSLDDVAPRTATRPPVFARPYVFGLQGHPVPIPNHEVSAAFWVPLTDLERPGVLSEFILEVGDTARSFPAYHLDQGIVWGMTERMLTLTLEIARQAAE